MVTLHVVPVNQQVKTKYWLHLFSFNKFAFSTIEKQKFVNIQFNLIIALHYAI